MYIDTSNLIDGISNNKKELNMDKIQINTILTTKGVDDENNIIEVIASKEVSDRDSDIVKIGGMDLTDFKKNPVILWAHAHHELPIGKAISVDKVGNELRMKIQFAKKEEYAFANTVYSLVKGGYLNAVSVGFMADRESIEYTKEASTGKTQRIINKSSLYELSIVPVPCNQDALVISRAVDEGVITKSAFDDYTSKLQTVSTEVNDTNLETKIKELNKQVKELELQLTLKDLELVELSETNVEADADDIYKSIFDEFIVGLQGSNKDDHTDKTTLLDSTNLEEVLAKLK